jgi:hypothetical protein
MSQCPHHPRVGERERITRRTRLRRLIGHM